jgi:hypothetical protein
VPPGSHRRAPERLESRTRVVGWVRDAGLLEWPTASRGKSWRQTHDHGQTLLASLVPASPAGGAFCERLPIPLRICNRVAALHTAAGRGPPFPGGGALRMSGPDCYPALDRSWGFGGAVPGNDKGPPPLLARGVEGAHPLWVTAEAEGIPDRLTTRRVPWQSRRLVHRSGQCGMNSEDASRRPPSPRRTRRCLAQAA